MAKDLFKFKQFDVYQKHGFKVSTEACIFGAYMSRNFPAPTVLDIGTGTGLLSLMYAQNNDAKIKSIEIDYEASMQAEENFSESKFKHIELIHNDVNTWSKRCAEKFDLIITNPPFFKNHLLGAQHSQNAAKHQSLLNLDQLASICSTLVQDSGSVGILLPTQEQNYFQQIMADFGFFPYTVLNVFNKLNTSQFRKIVIYSRLQMLNMSDEKVLVIYNDENEYTDEFKSLLSEYYIIF